jgi:D-lactate dehydrogenase
MLNAPYDELQRQLAAFIPVTRLVTDPLRLLAWGSDASFYRLVPQLVVVVDQRRRSAACAAWPVRR